MSIADEIAKLHDLLARGAITQSEFEQAKLKLLAQPTETESPAVNRLRLSDRDRWIAGVCGGIAAVTRVDSWIWRLLFVAGLFAGGFTFILYVLLWIFVPREGR
ncbi:MAG: PspC domain-containing protein [Burkholderiaceae bacterium]|nr:PspC domain-containing protein [Burkholderiaceae bacterium]